MIVSHGHYGQRVGSLQEGRHRYVPASTFATLGELTSMS